MRKYDFYIEQDRNTYYFFHKKSSIFYYNVNEPEFLKDLGFYDFNGFKISWDANTWTHDSNPLPIAEYNKWLFRQELQTLLKE